MRLASPTAALHLIAAILVVAAIAFVANVTVEHHRAQQARDGALYDCLGDASACEVAP